MSKKNSGWVTVLIVLSCVFIPLSIFTIWLHNTLLNTASYVETIAPLSTNPDIASSLANKITNKLFQKVNVEARVNDALPDNGKFLAAPLTDRLETFTQNSITKLIESPAFNKIWVGINRVAHQQIVNLLTGKRPALTVNQQGQVVLDLTPVIDKVKTRLNQQGITVFNDATFNPSDLQFTLFQSQQLAKAQNFVNLLNQLIIVIPVLTLIFIAGAILLAKDRLLAIKQLGKGTIIAVVVFLFFYLVARSLYIDSPHNLSTAAATAFFDIITRFLLLSSFLFVILGGMIVYAVSSTSAPIKTK